MNKSLLKLYISLLTRYTKTGTISERNLYSLEKIIDEVRCFLPIANKPFYPAQLERVTINKSIPQVGNRIITEIKYLKYPPSGNISKYGRCNLIGQSRLYGAFDMITASQEMRPEIGDIVTTSTWKIKSGMSIMTCPIFYITSADGIVHNPISLQFKTEHENFIRTYPKEYQDEINSIMEFLAKTFAKKIRNGDWKDYFLSAYLANTIFKNADPKIEMIIYPSVQGNLGSSNMVILPEVFDQKFELCKVEYGTCTTNRYPGYFYQGGKMTQTFDLEYGIIKW